MSLVSLQFFLFFPCVFLLYFLMPLKKRWVVLLVGSYVFYMANSVKLTLFLLVTSLTTFYAARRLDALNEETSEYLAEHKAELDRDAKKEYKAVQTGRKKRVLLAAVICNIGILCVLKYTDFIFRSLEQAVKFFGGEWHLPGISWLLPLGISFYTFQAVGYVIDVYRGKYRADRSLPQYMLFVSFFPQMIQGPISRHDQLAPQLYEGHRFDYTRVAMGFQLILWGMIKKIVLADRLALAAGEIFDNYLNYAGLTMFVGAAIYGLQVYADFSGGMDMVRGIGQIFGIEMALNFERPYFAGSLAEFWRRWHITLGAWMRDYVFYPVSLSKRFSRLGKKTKKWFGNQTGKMIPTFLAMFLTFMLVGIWHGAAWKYVAYGFWNAVIISSSILLEPLYQKMAEKCHIDVTSGGWRVFQMVRTFFLCSLGRMFSRGLSLRAALVMMKSFFTVWNPQVLTDGTFLKMGLTVRDWILVFVLLLVLLIVGVFQERGIKIRESVAKYPLAVRWTVYIGAFLLLLLFGMYGPGYSSAEFVYQQF
ncbi:MAG: MBOAT family O-acyltransferase [Candidatus Choladocola sp.]|nr:MBOAT family O-acyltransferase [Candidatus Choladocola sp.]